MKKSLNVFADKKVIIGAYCMYLIVTSVVCTSGYFHSDQLAFHIDGLLSGFISKIFLFLLFFIFCSVFFRFWTKQKLLQLLRYILIFSVIYFGLMLSLRFLLLDLPHIYNWYDFDERDIPYFLMPFVLLLGFFIRVTFFSKLQKISLKNTWILFLEAVFSASFISFVMLSLCLIGAGFFVSSGNIDHLVWASEEVLWRFSLAAVVLGFLSVFFVIQRQQISFAIKKLLWAAPTMVFSVIVFHEFSPWIIPSESLVVSQILVQVLSMSFWFAMYGLFLVLIMTRKITKTSNPSPQIRMK